MRRHQKKILLIVLFLALMGVAWYFGGELTFEEVKKNRGVFRRFVTSHYLLSVVAFIGTELAASFFLPVALGLTLAGGFLFGVVWGTVYIIVGLTLGASLAFLFARYVAGDWIHSKYKDRLKKFNQEIARHGTNYLLMMRIIPALPFFAVNFLAGMTRMSLMRFILTTAAGVLPGSIVFAYAGKQLGSIASAGDIMTPKLFIGFLVVGIFVLLPVIFRLLKARTSRHPHLPPPSEGEG